MRFFIPISALGFFFLTLFALSANNLNQIIIFGSLTISLSFASKPYTNSKPQKNVQDIVKKLESLQKMLSDELITLEEFDRAKRALLEPK